MPGTGVVPYCLTAFLGLGVGAVYLWRFMQAKRRRRRGRMLSRIRAAERLTDVQQTLKVLFECRSELKDEPVSRLHMLAAASLGNCYYNCGNFERAGFYTREAVNYAHALGDQRASASLLGDLALCHLGLGCAEEALQCHQLQLEAAQHSAGSSLPSSSAEEVARAWVGMAAA
eukprot:RCo006158